MRDWVMPLNFDHADAEAKHLVHIADDNKDGKLSLEEILSHYDTLYGEIILYFFKLNFYLVLALKQPIMGSNYKNTTLPTFNYLTILTICLVFKYIIKSKLFFLEFCYLNNYFGYFYILLT